MNRYKKTISMLVVVCMFTLIKGVSEQELFLRGNDYYNKGDYRAALNEYSAMHNKGRAVWYNMGNSSYKLGEKAQALVCWKRAQPGASSTELADISYNIHVLEKEYEVNEQKSFLATLYATVNAWATPCSLILLQIVFLAAWILLLYVWRKYSYKNVWILLGILLINIVCAVLLIVKYSATHQRIAIVKNNEVALYAGPNEQYHEVGVVGQMAQLLVQEERPSWCKVRYEQLTGWVPSEKIVVV